MTPLEAIIREKIEATGPITVAEYMELCLSHPEHGYYLHRDPFGAGGDFTTAPEVSQIFGELIGAWTASYWRSIGGGPMAVVELGPGRGTLMRDFLRATAHVEGFHAAISLTLVETSPNLTRLQRALLSDGKVRVRWATDVSALPAMRTVFIANEFFDALPVRQLVRTGTGLRERLVAIDPETGKLGFTAQEMGIRLVKGGAYADDAAVVESSPLSRQIAAKLGMHVKQYGGAGLAIDYGYSSGGKGSTLQAVRKHLYHPVLDTPGEADLTAHVDFDALAEAFVAGGATVSGPVGQGDFLNRLGAPLRAQHLADRASETRRKQILSGLYRLTEPREMGELFKVLAFCDDPRQTLPGFA